MTQFGDFLDQELPLMGLSHRYIHSDLDGRPYRHEIRKFVKYFWVFRRQILVAYIKTEPNAPGYLGDAGLFMVIDLVNECARKELESLFEKIRQKFGVYVSFVPYGCK